MGYPIMIPQNPDPTRPVPANFKKWYLDLTYAVFCLKGLVFFLSICGSAKLTTKRTKYFPNNTFDILLDV